MVLQYRCLGCRTVFEANKYVDPEPPPLRGG
jgi:hypothetical protein